MVTTGPEGWSWLWAVRPGGPELPQPQPWSGLEGREAKKRGFPLKRHSKRAAITTGSRHGKAWRRQAEGPAPRCGSQLCAPAHPGLPCAHLVTETGLSRGTLCKLLLSGCHLCRGQRFVSLGGWLCLLGPPCRPPAVGAGAPTAAPRLRPSVPGSCDAPSRVCPVRRLRQERGRGAGSASAPRPRPSWTALQPGGPWTCRCHGPRCCPPPTPRGPGQSAGSPGRPASDRVVTLQSPPQLRAAAGGSRGL